MANEAVIVQLFPEENAKEFTCASGTAIAKGTILKLAEPRTASASTAADVFAGIAAAAKAANDDATTIAAHTRGIFDLTTNIGSTITAGMMVSLSGANLIKAAVAAELLTGAAFGKALETSAKGTQEVIEVLVGGC